MNMYWNHNSAYYPWIKKKTAACRSILDVGCGDGSLVLYLNDGAKNLAGIDPDMRSIEKAQSANSESSVEFSCCSFEDYHPGIQFDAIIFVSSIHHMDMTKALQKAKSHLTPSGKLLVVGLAKPSTLADWIIEAARVIPSKLASAAHHMQSSEEMGIRTTYNYPQMNDVRSTVRQELPGARIRYALHYRYLLEWSASSGLWR